MARFVIRRALESFVAVFIVVTVVFFGIRLTGDPAVAMAPPYATEEDIQHIRATYGLDQSLGVQYAKFLKDVVTLDLGTSFRYGDSASRLVLERLPATFALAVGALLLAVIIGIPLGVLWGARVNPVISRVASAVAVFGQGIPSFWFGILLIYLFAVRLRLLPAFGSPTWPGIILPTVTLSIYSVPIVLRLTRAQMERVMATDYIRTGRALGWPEWKLLLKYALKNTAIPVVSVLGVRMNFMMGGAVVTETVFGYPGIGTLAVAALDARDFPVIQAFVLIVAVLVALVNLVIDLLYGWLDPRVSIQYKT